MNTCFRSALAFTLLMAGMASHADGLKNAASCTPGMSFWSLLGSVGIGYADGHLQMDKLYAVCLPQPKEPGDSNFAYSPEQGGKLTTLLQDLAGKTLTTYVWHAENVSGLWELTDYKVLGGFESIRPLTPGRYVLVFQADGVTFTRFPFSVAAMTSDDPYQPPGVRWFIDGAWSGYGNVFYQRNDPQSTLRFSTWVQDRVGHVQAQKSIAYEAQLERVADGKVIGVDKGTLRSDPQWRQLDVYFRPAAAAASERLKAAAVLGADGGWRVRLAIGGKPYGVYAFDVAGGKIEMAKAQADETEPTARIVDYLYGGRYHSYWLQREAGAQ